MMKNARLILTTGCVGAIPQIICNFEIEQAILHAVIMHSYLYLTQKAVLASHASHE